MRKFFALTLGLALFAAVAATSPSSAQVRSDGARLLPVSVPRGSLQNPCFAAGGARLVLTWFSRGYNQGGAGLWLVNSKSGALIRKLTDASDTNVNMPGRCYDAAARRIVFSSDPEGADQAFLIPFVGGALRQITRPPQIAWEPTFSPDGKWIVFESHRNGPKGEIWKVRVDGTGLARLSFGADDRQPNWGPANRIVFQRHGATQIDLIVMDAAGGNKQKLTNTPTLEETDVSWSPSGAFLVFSSDGPGVASASLFTIKADGTLRRRLTTAPRYDGAPSWSPDGSTIAFESFSGDPDGGPGTRIWTIAAPPGRR